jgi:hypothetical protein
MKPLLTALCLVVGCAPVPRARPPSQIGQQTAALFTDSSVYRAQCQEADTLPRLTAIPQKCTLRDQRVKIR